MIICLAAIFLSTQVGAEIIHNERSLYRNIIVEDTGDLRCLRFNVKNSKSSQSCFLKSNPQSLVFNYTKLLFSALLVNNQPERILIIGLGGGTMSNTLHQLFPKSRIDNVEIDPSVVKVARQYFGFFENENVKTYTQDGRIFIKRALLKKQKYDWIILDAFNGEYIPEHLLTQEFLTEAKQLLSTNGVLTSNTFSSSTLYAHESATYQSVYNEFFNVRNQKNNNRIILVSAQQLPSDKELLQRIEVLKPQLSPFNIDISAIYSSMTSSNTHQDWPENTRLLTDQFAPANLLNIE
ncbi:MAG: fused MFS/spermidine synthase [Colwellia sp.]|nr:fused MFS/spermidine synthase [Colwellia sp.]